MPYAHICFNAAKLGIRLGYKKISVIEFGVAKGAGLLSLENYCKKIERITGVEIDIYGFDTGKGLTEPKDFRDMRDHWQKGFFSLLSSPSVVFFLSSSLPRFIGEAETFFCFLLFRQLEPHS